MTTRNGSKKMIASAAEKFSDYELFSMFNVALDGSHAERLAKPLWKVTKGRDAAASSKPDKASASRLAELAAFYAANEEAEISPFDA